MAFIWVPDTGQSPQPQYPQSPDQIASAERMMRVIERYNKKELRKQIKKEEEDKKKKEADKKKEAEKNKGLRNFTALEWFLLLMIMYPFIGQYYTQWIKTLQ